MNKIHDWMFVSGVSSWAKKTIMFFGVAVMIILAAAIMYLIINIFSQLGVWGGIAGLLVIALVISAILSALDVWG